MMYLKINENAIKTYRIPLSAEDQPVDDHYVFDDYPPSKSTTMAPWFDSYVTFSGCILT